MIRQLCALLLAISVVSCSDDDPKSQTENLQLSTVSIGTYMLNLSNQSVNTDAPIDEPVLASFSNSLKISSVESSVILKEKISGNEVGVTFAYSNENKTFSMQSDDDLLPNTQYELIISDALQGEKNETYPGYTIAFETKPEQMFITSLKIDGSDVLSTTQIEDVAQLPSFEITFSRPLNPIYANSDYFKIANETTATATYTLSNGNATLTIEPTEELTHISRHQIWISGSVRGANEEYFNFFSKYFYTTLDPDPQMPVITDDELLTLVQQQTFKYFYDFAHPTSGMARERNTSGDVVTSGGSGFGIMALIVGMERNFITRQQGLDQMDKILDFLETADRFHGVWPHWLNGNTGDVVPFSTNDNGGDLVETSFLVQGLLTFRQYLDAGVPAESSLINRINVLWQGVEWDWYRRCEPTCQNVLYWHWSPDKNWVMNFPMYGYFEEQITYFLAAASPTHSIPKIAYSNGYGKNGAIVKNNVYEGITLPLESPSPLFWVHYSYLGMDPRFTDDYANYWTQNVNASLINQKYCIRNPKNFVGYSDECWGLTSSDNQDGYNAHSPSNDLGVITPTAALSSFPYTPVESMKALKFFYYKLGDRLWGQYGFYDAFNITEGWTADSYLAIDQGPIIVMIENYRTGLLWDLFKSAPEVQNGMTELNFTPNN